MKFRTALALGATLSGALAAVVPTEDSLASRGAQEKYLVELAPDQTRWVTEDEKWALKLDGKTFIDITDEADQSSESRSSLKARTVNYPPEMQHPTEVAPLTEHLSTSTMKQRLQRFSSFFTRYYRSRTGVQSAEWLYGQVQQVIDQSGAAKHGVTVDKFQHPWGQFSIIAKVPGRTARTVVVGGHQDSVNLHGNNLRSPGADDNGSGSITILEAFNALLQSDAIARGNAPNTVEFHWYAAEEAGLLGSKAIFSEYNKQNRNVKAMLQQDMTGYIQGMIDAGMEVSLGVIVDYVDPGLTQFMKKVISAYCDIPYAETTCGYACSDHASASRNGYPASFVFESPFELSNPKIHTADDVIGLVSFDHMLQHAKMCVGYAYELAFAPF